MSPFMRNFVAMLILTISMVARADLISAQKAYAAQDYDHAFELYRELAELGNVTGQENLAAMYVEGQGVKRDNVLGYAWASIARENGGSDAMQNIIDQLEPHLNDAYRKRVEEVRASYGKAALAESLLPAPMDPAKNPEQFKPGEWCTFSRPANPYDYYPGGAIAQGISGYVILEVTVMPDGRARNPRTTESVPPGVFDEAGRQVSFASVFKPRVVAGTAVPCKIKYKVKFFVRNPGAEPSVPGRIPDNSDKTFETAKNAAKAGDPLGQWLYALLLMQRPADPEHERALDWAVKAAQAGVADAQFEVGTWLINRKWLPDGERERKKGLAWFALAANSGKAEAQVELAVEALGHEPDAAAYDTAQDWLDRPGASGNRDGKLYLAALLAAGPNAARRDPARAIKLLDGAVAEFDSDPTSFEIRAAAHAQLGEFDDARSEQKRAIVAAQKLGWDLAPLKQRMANYEKGKAWTGSLIPF
jgi:TonB family protein